MGNARLPRRADPDCPTVHAFLRAPKAAQDQTFHLFDELIAQMFDEDKLLEKLCHICKLQGIFFVGITDEGAVISQSVLDQDIEGRDTASEMFDEMHATLDARTATLKQALEDARVETERQELAEFETPAELTAQVDALFSRRSK